MWNALNQQDIVLATYYYFYGTFQYERLKEQKDSLVNENLFYLNESAIKDLKSHIVQIGWSYIRENTVVNDIDDSKFADVFSCILLLQSYDIPELIEDLFRRQIENILHCLNNEAQLSLVLEQTLNIIFNTIRCSKIFFESSNFEPLIWQRFKRITNYTYPIDAFFLVNKLPEHFLGYKISKSSKKEFPKQNCYFTKEKGLEWIKSVDGAIMPTLLSKINQVNCINQLFQEIDSLRKQLVKKKCFSEWEECNDILDIDELIWKHWIISVFENRVYDISNNTVHSIIREFDSLLPAYEQPIRQSDLSIVDFVWNTTNFVKNNDFILLINKSCEIVDNHYRILSDNLVALKNDHRELLAKIYENVFQSFNLLKQCIDSHKSTKQFILFGAILYKKILESCPSLKSLFDSNPDSSAITLLEKQIVSISDDYLCQWFDIIIREHFEKISPNTFLDIGEFMKNLTLWEVVTLEKSEVNEGSSSVEVPVNLSLTTYSVLQNLCTDINRYCAFNVPRSLLIHILTLLGSRLFSLYSTSIEQIQSNNLLPTAAKQFMSLQLYFDLFFMKKLFVISSEENLKADSLKQILALMTSLESMIDPFDMHIIYPLLQVNCDRFVDSCYIVFGFLFEEKSIASLKSKSEHKAKHNIMLVHNCEQEFSVK